jgi:hypothetical protein
MKNETRITRSEINWMWSIIIVLVVFGVIFVLALDRELQNLPHKYCHNETEQVEVNCGDFVSIHTYEYVRPEVYAKGLIVENVTYRNISKEEEAVMRRFLNNIENLNNSVCYFNKVKEVCEVK